MLARKPVDPASVVVGRAPHSSVSARTRQERAGRNQPLFHTGDLGGGAADASSSPEGFCALGISVGKPVARGRLEAAARIPVSTAHWTMAETSLASPAANTAQLTIAEPMNSPTMITAEKMAETDTPFALFSPVTVSTT